MGNSFKGGYKELYLRFSTKPVVRSVRQGNGLPIVIIDFDKSNKVVGVEVLGDLIKP